MASETLCYVPFVSTIDISFWSKFAKLKVEELKLSEDAVPITATYSKQSIDGIPPLFNLGFESFQRISQENPREILCSGSIFNSNTIKDFKSAVKNSSKKKELSETIWNAMKDGTALENPSVLTRFLIHMFADLKNYHFYYWFAFPAFSQFAYNIIEPAKNLSQILHESMIVDFYNKYYAANHSISLSFFALEICSTDVILKPLTCYQALKKENKKVFLVFADPSSTKNIPGWPLRNLLTLAALQWPELKEHSVICLREYRNSNLSFTKSFVLKVALTTKEVPQECPDSVGWERNKQGRDGVLAPKHIDLKSSIDPIQIAKSATELNLNLMKWRVAPKLELQSIRDSRCLLFGAGTLGCNVARCLLGWSVNKITFVDCGKVSYSNPVRQSLFKFSDCGNGGRSKAETAAEALKEIYPGVGSSAVVLKVPMPGHVVSEKEIEETRENVNQIEELIKNHDVIYLLTDSRESRWLPSVLGLLHGKLVITSALGFDSYLVMRHGVWSEEKKINTLGCYFCNDVVAPRNSTVDRTLDQQCTVSRPGISMMAAGQAVELMVSTLQHPDKAAVGGPVDNELPVGILGSVPQCIRHFITEYMPHSVAPFDNCVACSRHIIEAYKENGFDFLLKVFNDSAYLEEASGITKLTNIDYDECCSIGSDISD